jgi:hypothetical protein
MQRSNVASGTWAKTPTEFLTAHHYSGLHLKRISSTYSTNDGGPPSSLRTNVNPKLNREAEPASTQLHISDVTAARYTAGLTSTGWSVMVVE